MKFYEEICSLDNVPIKSDILVSFINNLNIEESAIIYAIIKEFSNQTKTKIISKAAPGGKGLTYTFSSLPKDLQQILANFVSRFEIE